MPLTQPNHIQFPVDWSNSVSESKLRRAVFIASRKELKNPLLTLDVLVQQKRH